MKIKDPLRMRNQFAEKGLLTYDEIAKAININPRTVGRILSGDPVRYKTVYKVSEFLGLPAGEIAEFIAEN